MELKGSKTEANLWKAFAGESQARNKYDYYRHITAVRHNIMPIIT